MKRIKLYFPLIIMLFVYQQATAQNADFLMDERDGNIYLVAKFNNTWWMCQNLKYDAGEGSGCYENDETNCMLKGRMYDWTTALKSCPQGYHLPGDDEWKAMESYLGMSDEDLDGTFNRNSGTIGKYLKMGGGIGFDAEFMGLINHKGNSSYAEIRAYFWTASEVNAALAWGRILDKNKDGVERQSFDKKNKFAVRCIKEAAPEETEAGEEVVPD